jgi:hypothetical protein
VLGARAPKVPFAETARTATKWAKFFAVGRQFEYSRNHLHKIIWIFRVWLVSPDYCRRRRLLQQVPRRRFKYELYGHLVDLDV